MFNLPLPSIEWQAILPMILVAGAGMLALFIELIVPKRTNNLMVGVCLVGLLAGMFSVIRNIGTGVGESFGGMVLTDGFGQAAQILIMVATFLCILFSEGYLREKRIPFGEFYPLAMWSATGALLMVSTTNLLMIFLGLEVLSIALYVMAGMSRSEDKSEESALKYFLLGAFASGFLLYGIAFIYGATGSLELGVIQQVWVQNAQASQTMIVFGLGLMLIGLSFKGAFVPFHQWTPDVYQGAPTNVAAFMAAVSKIGAFGALWRVLDSTQGLSQYWLPALFWIAILTMTIGNLIALVQKDVKRILGYSSIAHAGYILVAVVSHAKSPAEIDYRATIYYLLSYILMTIGAFAVVSMSARSGKESTGLSSLHGLWKRSPLAAAALLVFMFSLVGVPPTAGFIGKLLIFNDAVTAGLTPLAIVLAVNSIISIYYYLGITRAAFVEEDAAMTSRPVSFGLAGTCVLCAAGVLACAVFFTPISQFIGLR